MATIKIKFRASCLECKEGSVYYQVIHGRIAKQIRTGYKLFPFEWNRQLSRIVFSLANRERNWYLAELEKAITEDHRRLEQIILMLERKGIPYTSEDIVLAFKNNKGADLLFFGFMRKIAEQFMQVGKCRTSETYLSTLRSFMLFRKNKDVIFDEVSSDLMIAYEAWLKSNGIAMNTISFYMRILRATYNRAVEKGLTVQQYPFRHVYTGIAKTVKRAISLETIRQLKAMKLSLNGSKSYARDMFLFSFYTRGMSFVDMAFLKKTDLNRGILSYRRKKTGQLLFIKWEPCMQEIIERYNNPQSPYLLPIVKWTETNERRQYLNESHRINKYLRIIGKELQLSITLTLYVARHAWASIAKSKNISISVISEGMGHDSETTTKIYLASLDTAPVDNANRLILNLLRGNER